MTSDELVEQTLRRIVPAPPLDARASLRTALAVLIKASLRLLPVRVREKLGSADAEIYRKNYTVALTSGQGSLSTHTDLTAEPMIASEIVKVTHPDAITATNADGKLRQLGSSSALDYPRSLEFAYFAVENNTLFTMMSNVRTTLGTNATVRAAFPPAIVSVKFSHESILIECLLELFQGPAAKAA